MARSSIRHHPQAADELQAAADWYSRHDPRAAARFIAAVKSKLKEIRATPARWPLEADGIRQALLPKFKYTVVFREHKGTILILAYAHASREPGYWRSRLNP
jgi:toxin ParE1/3/4